MSILPTSDKFENGKHHSSTSDEMNDEFIALEDFIVFHKFT